MSFILEDGFEVVLGEPRGYYFDDTPSYDEERYFEVVGLLSGHMRSDIKRREVTIGRLFSVGFRTEKETYDQLHYDENARNLILGNLATILQIESELDQISERRLQRRVARQSSSDVVE